MNKKKKKKKRYVEVEVFDWYEIFIAILSYPLILFGNIIVLIFILLTTMVYFILSFIPLVNASMLDALKYIDDLNLSKIIIAGFNFDLFQTKKRFEVKNE